MLEREIAAQEIVRCREVIRAKGWPDVRFKVLWGVRAEWKNGHASVKIHAREGAIRVEYLVSFNRCVAVAAGEAFRQTVAHEVAHIVTFARMFDICSAQDNPRAFIRQWNALLKTYQWGFHGREWGAAMDAFGWPAKRRSSYGMAVHAQAASMRAEERQRRAATMP
jgi:hypothetical protein